MMAAAAGGCHSAAVGEDGALFVWGSGQFGQLGTGDTASRLAPTRVGGLSAPVRQVAAGPSHTGIVTEAGDLLMCCLLYTSPSPRDATLSRMPSSA